MVIEQMQEGEVLRIAPSGSLDTVNTPEFQRVVISAFQKSNKVTIDLDNVAYVSSAGLRAFLLGQKTADSKQAEFVIINVNESVMSVFKMSGFSELLNIK